MFIGGSGPLVAPFVNAATPTRQNFVATHATLMTFQHLFKVIIFGVLGFAFGPYLPLLVGLLLLLLGIYAFFALSARNEIYYLCGNFKSGVSYSSVVRQLDTANLSDYKIETSEQGKRVTHTSALHLNLIRCEIIFTEDEKVSHAIYK